MSINYKRSLERAEKYLKIIKKFIKSERRFYKEKNLDDFKSNKVYEWLKANSARMQEEINSLDVNNYLLISSSKKSDLNGIFYALPISLELYFLSDDNDEDILERATTIKELLLVYIQLVQEMLEDEGGISSIIPENSKEGILLKILDNIKNTLISTHLSKYFKNNKECMILRNNFLSLVEFEKNENYKYCMVAMGAIIEFLLIRYCNKKNIAPLDNKGNTVKKKNSNFWNYVQVAIMHNIFNEKRRWELIQSHLRDFRNYIHIEKEIKSTLIDESWFNTMKPVFNSILEKFKTTPI